MILTDHCQVLCNNPKKYAVVEPEGKILGQKCVDIVIRHVAVSPQTCETTDKFRIHMFEEGSAEVSLLSRGRLLYSIIYIYMYI